MKKRTVFIAFLLVIFVEVLYSKSIVFFANFGIYIPQPVTETLIYASSGIDPVSISIFHYNKFGIHYFLNHEKTKQIEKKDIDFLYEKSLSTTSDFSEESFFSTVKEKLNTQNYYLYVTQDYGFALFIIDIETNDIYVFNAP